MLDPRFERSVRRWLWAYPRRWRWARADEVVGTLADIAPPGATRLDVRSGLGLVVHGVATRRRMRPPLRVRRRYRWVNGVVPPEDRGWVADKIASPWFQAGPLLGLAIYELTFTMLRAYNGDGAFGEVAWAGSVALALLLVPKTHARRAAATRHLVVRPGDPPTAWDLMPGWVYRDRFSARSVLQAAATALVPVTVLTAALTATERSGDAIVLAACVSVGSLAAARLAVRWRRWALRRPGQPARHLLDAGRRWTVAIWIAALAAVLTAVPWTAPFSRDGLVLAPVVLGGALTILPVLALAALLTRNAPGDIAVIDVWRLLVGRGPLPVDTLERGVVPASFALQAPDGFGYAPPPSPTPATA